MKILEDVELKHFSTIKIGGKAKKVYMPENLDDIRFLIEKSLNENKKFIPIGVGSNTIFKDGKLDHIFVSTKFLKKLEFSFENGSCFIDAQAGVSFKQILALVEKFNLKGFENLSGIPASVGGAVYMNAGAFGSEIFDIVEEVHWLDKKGQLFEDKKENIEYSYRKTQFQKDVSFIYKVRLRLSPSKTDIKSVIKQHLLKRKKAQPLNLPTSGSTYKNPSNDYAGRLLEEAGYKGKRVNDIGFSEKHANFLVNYGNAEFKDLMKLLESAERDIEKEFNIKLEREIKIVE